MKENVAIDCFCGAGGLSQGFISAGFNIVYAFDSDEACVNTYKRNIGEHVYEEKSEIITNPIDIPNGTRAIELKTKDNEMGEIYYYVSVNDGLDWQRMDPVGTPPVFIADPEEEITATNFRILPQRVYINSDISSERKEANDAGIQAFFNTITDNIRLRAVLIKTDTVPQIESIEPTFLDYE